MDLITQINNALNKKKENLDDTISEIISSTIHRLSVGREPICWYNSKEWSNNWSSDEYCPYNSHVNYAIFNELELEYMQDFLIGYGFEVIKKSRFFGFQTWYEVYIPKNLL